MKKVRLLSFLLFVMLLTACGTTQTVPLTGRQHRIGVTDGQVLSLSNQEYTKYMQTAKRSADVANTVMVERVGKRLANAVESYLRNNGYASEIKNYSWEFNLVQDKSVNAFCLPGGKIVVYEGLLPYTQTEDALAIVLGHEIAHAVAKHSAEQLTKQQNQQAGTSILGSVLDAAVGNNVGSIASTVAGQYFSFRNLKYSRDNESEADHMGLIFAAMAGYNPEVAVPFWQRMANASGSGRSDIFSDHPSDAKRIAAIQKEMPEALKYYHPAEGGVTSTVKKSVARTKKSIYKNKIK